MIVPDPIGGRLGEETERQLDSELRHQGFDAVGWKGEVPGTKVYQRKWGSIMIVSSIDGEQRDAVTSVPTSRATSSSSAAEGYFQRLRNDLEILLGKHPRIRDIFLPGGGTTALPKNFDAWCDAHHIRRHIIPPENIDDLFRRIAQIAITDQEESVAKAEIDRVSKKLGLELDI